MSSLLAGGIATLDRWEGLKEWHRRHQELLQGSNVTSNPEGYETQKVENNSILCKNGNGSRGNPTEFNIQQPTTVKHDLSIISEGDEDSRSKDGDLNPVRSKQGLPKDESLAMKGPMKEKCSAPSTRANLLSDHLKNDVKQNPNGSQKGKRPFLRRGQGLARYNLQPDDVKHPYKKKSVTQNASKVVKSSSKFVSLINSHNSNETKKLSVKARQDASKVLKGVGLTAPMQRLVLTVPSMNSNSAEIGTWSQVFGGDTQSSIVPNSGNTIEECHSELLTKQEMTKLPKILNERPIAKTIFSPTRKTNFNSKQDASPEEDQESLAAYLDLEQHVGNASFCSTSSKVDRLVAKSSSTILHQSNPDAIAQSKPLTPVKTGRKFLSSTRENNISVDQYGIWSATELENLVKARAGRSKYLVRSSLESSKVEVDEFRAVGVSQMPTSDPAAKSNEEELVRISPCEPPQESQEIDWMLEDLGIQRKPHLMKTMPSIDLDSSLIKNALAPTRDYEDHHSSFSSESSSSSSESSSVEDIREHFSPENKNCSKHSVSVTEEIQTDKDNRNSPAPLIPINDIALKEINNQIESHLSDLRKEIETLQSAKGKTQKYMLNLEKKVQELEHKLILDARSFNKRLEDERAASSKKLSEEQAKFLKEKQALQKTIREQRKKAPDPITQQELMQLRQEITHWEERWRTDRAKARGLESNLRIQISNMKRENEKLKDENNKLRREKEMVLSTAKAKATSNTRIINSIAHNLAQTKAKVVTSREDNSKSKQPAKDSYRASSAYNLKSTKLTKDHSISKPVTSIENFPCVPNEWSTDEEVDLGQETSDEEDINNEINTKEGIGSTLHLPKVSFDIAPRSGNGSEHLTEYEQATVDLEETQAKYDAIFGKGHVDSCVKTTTNEVTNPLIFPETIQVATSPSVSKGAEIIETEQFVKSILHPDGKTEQIKENGTRVITYPDGTWKRHSCSGSVMTVPPSGWPVQISYFNGDQLEKLSDGTTRYYYAKTNVWQTTFPDGHEELIYPSGQVERREQDGSVKVLLPNSDQDCNSKAPISRAGDTSSNGISVEKLQNGDTILRFPNGERELHTKEYMKKDFLDGTIKFLYKDGSQETRYPSGRVRVKDNQGNLVKDSIPIC